MRRLAATALAVIVLTVSTVPPVLAHDGINRLTNQYRVEHGRSLLRTNDNLNRLARLRVRQIPYRFTHDFWWMRQTKCEYGGENIAMRRPATAPGTRARWFVNAWIESPTHEHNILGWGWKRTGSAIYITPDGAMWGVQIFCDPRD